jgi:Icc-related predicted phosphoesterase
VKIVGEDTDDWTVRILNEVAEYNLDVISTRYDSDEDFTVLQVELPEVEPGLYDLWIRPSSDPDSTPMVEPHSIAVKLSLQPPFDVLHVTDTHYDTSEGQLHLKKYTQRTIRLINFLRPDFVLHTGDACNNPREEFFSGFRQELLALEVPIIVIPGNHDHAGEKNFFETYISPWDGSLDIGPVHLVYLDTGEYSGAGGLGPDQVQWLRADLEESSESSVRIFMSHHPIFSSPPGYLKVNSGLQNLTDANVDILVSILEEYEVNLLLHGHIHENIVRHEPILSLTTSNAYEGGTLYSGFRIITINSDGSVSWHYNGTQNAIPIFDIDVKYLQQYHPQRFIDGYPSGAVVSLINNLEITVDGTLDFRLQNDQNIEISGGTIQTVSNAGDHVLVSVETSLTPGDEKTVTISTIEDNEPPEILEPDIDMVESRTVRLLKMNWTVVDSGSGIQQAGLTYSTDNQTWSEEELLQVSINHFGGTIQIPIDEERIFYRFGAQDPLGNEATFGPSMMTFETEEPTEPGERAVPFDNYLLLGAVIAVLASLAVLLYLRTQRTR